MITFQMMMMILLIIQKKLRKLMMKMIQEDFQSLEDLDMML